MELAWIWKSVLIFIIGTLILRIGGRKSISQMTISQTIVMIGLGSLLVQPVAEKGLFVTFGAAFILVVLMLTAELLQVKLDFVETFISGKSVVVVENGKLKINELKKVRLTVDQLETRLRQVGISSIEDIKYATIEISGQLGYELKDDKKPLTREEFLSIMGEVTNIDKSKIKQKLKDKNKNNIFKEIDQKKFEGNKNEP
ncbi:MAG: DUF421 domain-containing protein [Tissierella sp.]|uniref:DUF421 domain-containing protein n=1 Tax=Tissierella sp. TaxID=41274 RepID=UPI003F97AB19